MPMRLLPGFTALVRYALAVLLPFICVLTLPVYATQPEFEVAAPTLALPDIETITIIGKQTGLPGVATTLTEQDLARFSVTDAHKILSIVPGVHFRSEEGYGLRPNIGIRGTPSERSSRVTIMEDGVLAAPAPYSASSAYYFPSIGRMSRVEVVKGPAALTEGPYTIGGAINFISTQIPDKDIHANIRQELGADQLTRTKAAVGFSSESGVAGLLETHLHQTNGFDTIARAPNDTGFNVRDYLGKLRFLRELERSTHRLDIKYSVAQQDSQQTYVGLTEADFQRDAHERYGLTAYDEFNSRHRSISLRYLLETEGFKLQATAFGNRFKRDWFKVHDLDLSGNQAPANYQVTSIGSVFDLANGGDPHATGVLQGEQDALVRLKHNARQYLSQGLSLHATWTLNAHELRAGWRQIEDAEDRLQNYEFTRQSGGQLSPLFDATVPSGGDNRIIEGEGTSAFLQDVMTFGAWSVRLGIRHESYRLREKRYEGGEARSAIKAGYPRVSADDSVTLFGGGAVWSVAPSVDVFLGFHQGFTPTRGDASPETADNWEAGARYQRHSTRVEAALFNSDYKNIVGQCSNSAQGVAANCDPGDEFNGGRATIKGLEFYAEHSIKISNAVQIPLSLSYSYTDSAFDTTFTDNEYWGEVNAGDAIPYLPKHQVALRIGVQIRHWNVDLQRLSYSGTCAVVSCQSFTTIDAWHNYDLRINRVFPDRHLTFYAAVQNLTDEKNIVTRHPNNGARAQQPRALLVGVNYRFDRKR